MGKKARRNNKKKQRKKALKNYKPFISICTPTFNRRPFIPYMIQCYLHQDYPRDRMEWIIIDDGCDHIEDLVSDISGVNYFKYDEKMTLGKKRNLMHEKSKGEIIVYMDDDDYYPPERVSHAVNMLRSNKKALCAGSSEIHIWFKEINKMIQFGPYGPQHATAGTFAFKRELLDQTSYDETASLAEEKHFLKNYTIPFVQLNPRKTILVFSHDHNTFDKRKLLKTRTKNDKFIRDSTYTIDDFMKEPELIDFFTNKITGLLNDYELGMPKYKPDVLQQTKEIEKRRAKMAQEHNKNAPIVVQGDDGSERQLNNVEIVTMLRKYQGQLNQANQIIQTLKTKVSSQETIIEQLQLKLANSETSEEPEKIVFKIKEKDVKENEVNDDKEIGTEEDNTI